MQKNRSNVINQGIIGEAIALFVRNEAALLAQVTETNKVLAESERRFTRIEAELEQIKAILRHLTSVVERHEQILNDLPEVIRQKIGFKTRT
jgi:K+/H+ antiporter YhaU regulatory subunit KhtT